MIKFIRSHKYCLWLLYFVVYAPAFFLIERFVTPKYKLTCSIDYKIPFIQQFAYAYCLWFFLLVISFLLLINDREAFLDLCFMMFTGMSVCLIIYILFPGYIDLRPQSGKINTHLLSGKLCAMLYKADNPANVCPSIHVASSVSIAMAVFRSKKFGKNKHVKSAFLFMACLIIVSTFFIKQHSIYDAAAGIILSCILYVICYKTPLISSLEEKYRPQIK